MMKFQTLLIVGAVAGIGVNGVSGNDYSIPPFPPGPSMEALLDANGLAQASEEELANYVSRNASAIESWIPAITSREESTVGGTYIGLLDKGDPNAKTYWQKKTTEMTEQRLHDPRRIVDAALRRLGQVGTPRCFDSLIGTARYVEPVWAQWKAWASIQEVLARQNPIKDQRFTFDGGIRSEMGSHDLALVAPLLRDLPAEKAESWAWVLWRPARPDVDTLLIRRDLPIRVRLWLARFFARQQPQIATAVFTDGLKSRDAAVRTLAEMLLREVLGGSIPYKTDAGALLKMLEAREWKPAGAYWQTMPKPLSTPLVLRGRGSRTDLVWLDITGGITRREDDVWPSADQVLPNGLFYDRYGDSFPIPYVLSSAEGDVYARFDGTHGNEVIATHGGLWCVAGNKAHATEFAADGSVLWQCPLHGSDIRAITPYTAGRVLCLGYKYLECRNRRGDVLWKIDLETRDDPRWVLAVGEEKFLLSCTKSVGWLTKAGVYTPILENLGSAIWIRYHPEGEWVIFDGANWQALIFDPASKKVTGRIDLDDDGVTTKSRYATDQVRLPE